MVCFLNRHSVQMGVGQQFSDNSEWSSQHSWKPYRPPGGGIFVVFSGDFFFDML